jgi:hypothetical protein
LLDRRNLEDACHDLLGEHGGERLGEDGPAEPNGGGERLSGRAQVDDPVAGKAIARADRRPVQAQGGVVLVLDDQCARLVSPADQSRLPFPGEDRRSELVAAGRCDGRRANRTELADESVSVE